MSDFEKPKIDRNFLEAFSQDWKGKSYSDVVKDQKHALDSIPLIVRKLPKISEDELRLFRDLAEGVVFSVPEWTLVDGAYIEDNEIHIPFESKESALLISIYAGKGDTCPRAAIGGGPRSEEEAYLDRSLKGVSIYIRDEVGSTVLGESEEFGVVYFEPVIQGSIYRIHFGED